MKNINQKQGKRHNARRAALKAFYQWYYNPVAEDVLLKHFLSDTELQALDQDYFYDLVMGALASIESIDASFTPYLDRSVKSLNPIELAILRLSSYELLRHPEIPQRVVINEAIELGKEFGSEQGYKYLNGILDQVAKQQSQKSSEIEGD